MPQRQAHGKCNGDAPTPGERAWPPRSFAERTKHRLVGAARDKRYFGGGTVLGGSGLAVGIFSAFLFSREASAACLSSWRQVSSST